nr:SAM-dependent methyltransferase [Streptomyces daqingensis]
MNTPEDHAPEDQPHPLRRTGGPSGGEWTTWRAAAERALYGTSGVGGTGPRDDGDGSAAGNGVRAGNAAGKGVGDGNGPDLQLPGFFVRERPGAHFRTSVHASPLFAQAVARLLLYVDEALGHPAELAFVDVGAGAGELLTGVLAALPEEAAGRVRPYAVERAPRPEGLDERVVWLPELPAAAGLSGLLFANEWLDNVPVDVVETGPGGVPHTVLVRPSDGAERLGGPPEGPDAAWLAQWWPLAPGGLPATADPTLSYPEAREPEVGLRAEIGRPRDEAWAAAVLTLERGLAVAVDYAHFRENRPPFGTLTGYLDGRETRPVPDGSRDLTAHVALDACAAAGALAAQRRRRASGPADDHAVRGRTDGGRGRPDDTDVEASHSEDAAADRYAAAKYAEDGYAPGEYAQAGYTGEGRLPGGRADGGRGRPDDTGVEPSAQPVLLSQRDALHALGVHGARPPLRLASAEPAEYVRQLAAAGEAAELTDPGGLGAFSWLVQPLGGVSPPVSPPFR